ncbi:PAS domain S-box protein [Halorubrum halophilum]|uniref:PAS domain S-box protein n=1 Tax=Halorubrum halophilum TaxID=413816 RepID=UPI00186B35E6|nr:PAS domain S-box protein [Halorubrum halophilum]
MSPGAQPETPPVPDAGFFASFVEDCSDPVVSIDEHGTVVHANPATEAVVGYDPGLLCEQPLASIVADDDPDAFVASLCDRLTEADGAAAVGTVPVSIRHADGHALTFSVQFYRHSVDDEAAGAVYTGVFRDGIEGDGGAELATFRNLVEHAGHAIYVTDTDGTIEYVNPAFTKHTGFEKHEAIGETPAILNSGEMDDAYFEALWATVLDGEVWEEELVDRRRGGELYHAHQTIAPVTDDDGEVTRLVAIQTDITDRKEAMARLKQYRDIVERLDDPVLLQNRDGGFELLNEAVSEFAGVPREELYGETEAAFMDDATAEDIDDHRRAVLATETPREYETSPEFPHSGKEATFSTQRSPYYDGDGDLVGTFAICRNITDRKERERELERYERAINGATDLIAAVDRDKQLLFANPQYREYHGIGPGDVTGLTLEDVVAPEGYETVDRQVERALEGTTVEYRAQRTHPVRGTRTFDIRYYPLQEPGSEEPAGVVGVLRDVTDSENRARQLRVVDRVLQHNLRNALTVIRGQARQIASGEAQTGGASDVDEGVVDAAEYVISRADTLMETSEKAHHITEVLGDSPEIEPVDVGRAARQIAETIGTEHPAATVEVSVPDDGTAVAAATAWISRAMAELVRNSIVHHDREAPAVAVRVTADDERVTVEVEDDGPGLTGMNRDVLVDGTAVDALYHGSGLGLWLVYWVVQQSGGVAAVQEAEPRGTVVTLTLSRSDC